MPDSGLMRFALTQTIVLLVASNVFMTFAWYGHLKNFQGLPWWIAALASWGIALFEPGAVYFIFRGR